MARVYGMAMPVRRSQRIRGRQEEPIASGAPSVVPSADDFAALTTATMSPAASTPAVEAYRSRAATLAASETAAVRKPAPVKISDAPSKWSLRPRKLTRGRLQQAQGQAPKRKHDELMPDLDTVSLHSQKNVLTSLKKSSEVLEAEARSKKYFSLQHSRCMQLVSKAPWRRYWRKMSMHEAFLRREERIREALRKRECDLRELWQKEVSAMRIELADLQSQQAEGVKQLQAVHADRQAVTLERRQEEKQHDAAVSDLQQKIQALGGSAESAKVLLTKVVPNRLAAQKGAPRRRNNGWTNKPKPRKAAPARQPASAGQPTEAPEAPPYPKGPPSPKAAPSTQKSAAMLEASPAPTKRTGVMIEASPPPAKLPAQSVPDCSPMSSQRSAMSPISPRHAGSPLARSPPRSPSVPKCSAPFVEFVGPPVGKGSKVPGNMWPWPTEMMTRSRAKAL
eukprot:TRINITY_DN27630_c0_g1_i2.p1 TRINITY_DN27630_c0_g1~~TRINITY_DN27630_c0_g1_i2.p1  ORF type:complete len:451 (+),score=76.97 TRINITY_DN27630_c0_g1_i2:143-1495(+)